MAATVNEVAGLVSSDNLQVSSLSLHFYVTLLQTQPKQGAAVADKVLPQALELVKSPLLQVSHTLQLQTEPHVATVHCRQLRQLG